MAGKTAGLLGVNVSLASILKQSQIFTGVFGTVFQILGAFVDIMLIPLMPVIKWVLNNMIDFIPEVQKKAASLEGFGKRVQSYLEDLFHDKDLWGRGGVLWTLAADIGTVLKNWWLNTAWPLITEFIEKLWNMTPWGKPDGVGDEAEAMAKKMTESMKRQGIGIGQVPFGKAITKPRGGGMGAGFIGSGQTDEFEDLGYPEGYGPNTGKPKNLAEAAADLGYSIKDFIGQSAEVAPAVAGMAFGGLTEIAEKGLDIFTGADVGQMGVGGYNLDRFQAHLTDQAFREVQEAGDAALRMGYAMDNYMFAPTPTGSSAPATSILRSMVPTINDMSQELNMIDNHNTHRDQTNASMAISLTQKDNFKAAYVHEANQYEDDLYFQEMMLGIGRH